jgi:hypothetical protein
VRGGVTSCTEAGLTAPRGALYKNRQIRVEGGSDMLTGGCVLSNIGKGVREGEA